MENLPQDPQNKKKRAIALGALLSFVIIGGIVYQVALKPHSGAEGDAPATPAESTHTDPNLPSETVGTAPGAGGGANVLTGAGTETYSATTPDSAASPSTAGGTSTGTTAAGGVGIGAGATMAGNGSTSDAGAAGNATGVPSPGFFSSLRARFNGFFGSGGGMKAPGTSPEGMVDAGSLAPGAGQELAKSEAPKVDISRDCFVETFTHKPSKSHSSGEACSQHRNVLKIAQSEINPKSVCVRVNGNPVRYQTGKAGEFVLGPIAGPEAKITVRYCMAKASVANCDDCRIPKDEFMEAIGGVAEDGSEGAAYVKWDPNGAETDDDVSAKLDPELRRELANATDMKLFDGWMSGGNETACHTRTAAKDSTSPNG